MLREEYDEVSTMNAIRQEALEEGLEKGEQIGLEKGEVIGIFSTVLEFLREGLISLEEAARKLDMSQSKIEELLDYKELR